MKHYKIAQKNVAKSHSNSTPTTRQEIDEISKHIAQHIEKNPAKAARLFENWLKGKPKSQQKKKAA
jgi:hypothetical protein